MTEKTTIRNIDPDTLWDAKIYAAQTKLTMGEVVTIALERLIQEEDYPPAATSSNSAQENPS